MKIPSVLLLLAPFTIIAVACATVATPVPVPTAAQTPVPAPATPTTAPTPNIEATVEALLQATITAQPTSTPLPTPSPTPVPTPTLAPIATPPPAPTATPAPAATPTIMAKVSPTPAPRSVRGSGAGGGGSKLDPTPENYPLILLVEAHPALASRVMELAWVKDGISPDESEVLSHFRRLVSRESALADQIVDMPFFTESAEEGDVWTLWSLNELSISYPRDLRLLTQQDWFADGLSQNEAYYVTILRRHAVLRTLEIFGPDDYKTLVVKDLGGEAMTRTISLPQAGEVKLVAFNRPPYQRDATRVIDHLEKAMGVIEEFMMAPFPEKQVLLLFTDPGNTSRTSRIEIVARFLGTHMIASPNLGPNDLNEILTHELAHYYLTGGANNGLPPWFSEGGPEFLAAYFMDRSNIKSLEERRKNLVSNHGQVTFCKDRRGISSIQKLLDLIAEKGYHEASNSTAFFCNYSYGEILFLDLYKTMGDAPFREAWNEIYELSESVDRLVTEDEIYEAFLSRVPADKISEFKEIYQRWHGGEFG